MVTVRVHGVRAGWAKYAKPDVSASGLVHHLGAREGRLKMARAGLVRVFREIQTSFSIKCISEAEYTDDVEAVTCGLHDAFFLSFCGIYRRREFVLTHSRKMQLSMLVRSKLRESQKYAGTYLALALQGGMARALELGVILRKQGFAVAGSRWRHAMDRRCLRVARARQWDYNT